MQSVVPPVAHGEGADKQRLDRETDGFIKQNVDDLKQAQVSVGGGVVCVCVCDIVCASLCVSVCMWHVCAFMHAWERVTEWIHACMHVFTHVFVFIIRHLMGVFFISNSSILTLVYLHQQFLHNNCKLPLWTVYKVLSENYPQWKVSRLTCHVPAH